MLRFDPRLYLVTQRYNYSREEFLERVDAAIRGGVSAVQLREKQAEGREFYELALALGALCRQRRVSFWVNDRVDVALAAQADGVHVGQADLPAEALRRILPRQTLLGVSAYTVAEARPPQAGVELQRARCSGTKPPIKLLSKREEPGHSCRSAHTHFPRRHQRDNAAAPAAAGADGVAVVSANMLAADPHAAAKKLRQLVDEALATRQ